MPGIVLLGTEHDRVVNFRNQRWWADKGLICLENKDTGDFTSMTVRTCLQRMNALSEMVGNSKKRTAGNAPHLIQEHQDFLDRMVELCQQAQQQGRPDVAAHRQQMLDKLKTDRQSKMVVVPSYRSQF